MLHHWQRWFYSLFAYACVSSAPWYGFFCHGRWRTQQPWTSSLLGLLVWASSSRKRWYRRAVLLSSARAPLLVPAPSFQWPGAVGFSTQLTLSRTPGLGHHEAGWSQVRLAWSLQGCQGMGNCMRGMSVCKSQSTHQNAPRTVSDSGQAVCQLSTGNRVDCLHWFMLGLRLADKEDLDAASAELVLGQPLCIWVDCLCSRQWLHQQHHV